MSETHPLLAGARRTSNNSPSSTNNNNNNNVTTSSSTDRLSHALKQHIPNIQSGTVTYSHPPTTTVIATTTSSSTTATTTTGTSGMTTTTTSMTRHNTKHKRGVSLSDLFSVPKDINSNNHHRSMIRKFAQSIVQTTASEINEAFQKDVQDTRAGKRFFMDMTMTRNLSVMPEQLSDLLDEAIEDFNFSSRTSTEYHPLRIPMYDDEIDHHHHRYENEEEASSLLLFHKDKHDQGNLFQEGILGEAEAAEKSKHQVPESGSFLKVQDSNEMSSAEADEPTKSKGGILSAYIGLFVAVIAVSSNGTALSLLHGVDPCLKLYWRMTATAMLLSFFAFRSAQRQWNKNINNAVDAQNNNNNNISNSNNNNNNNANFSAIMLSMYENIELSTVLVFMGAVVSFTIHTMLYFYAFAHTSIGNAVIFANSQALLLIIGKAFVGERVLCVELIGVIVAFSGAILCSAESDEKEVPVLPNDGNSTTGSMFINTTTTTPIVATTPRRMLVANHDDDDLFENIYGDALALGAAVTGVIYLTFAKAVRTQIKTTVFVFLIMFFGSFLVLLYMYASGVHFTINNHKTHGLFGWVTFSDNHLYILLYIAVVCNVGGTMGFVKAMKYFDNLIIAVATLLEPMIASLIAYSFNVGPMPGLLGWIGNVMVAVGTIAVVYPSTVMTTKDTTTTTSTASTSTGGVGGH